MSIIIVVIIMIQAIKSLQLDVHSEWQESIRNKIEADGKENRRPQVLYLTSEMAVQSHNAFVFQT